MRALVAEADLVLRVRIRTRTDVAPQSTETPASDRPSVEAEVLEVLKSGGQVHVGERISFVQHGHGVATFEPGRDHLLFLMRIARSRELDALAESNAHVWVSLQEHDDAHPLDTSSREVLLAATRDFAAAEGKPAEARIALLRAGTLRLITSGDVRLAGPALRDLATQPGVPLIDTADVPRLLAVVDDPATPIGVRVALLAELERRNLVDGGARTVVLLSNETPSEDLVVAIRASAHDVRPATRARLIELLVSGQPGVAAAAAIALGQPGDATVVPTLTQALDDPSSRVRQAAIRGLGSTRTPEALRSLEKAAKSNPDPATRRLAGAAARKLVARTAAP